MIGRTLADRPLAIVALLLTLFGIAIVYSAGQTDAPVAYIAHAYQRQLGWFAVGLGAAYLVSRGSVRLLEWLAWPTYVVGIGVLLVTLAFGSGAGTAASQKGWLIPPMRLGVRVKYFSMTP